MLPGTQRALTAITGFAIFSILASLHHIASLNYQLRNLALALSHGRNFVDFDDTAVTNATLGFSKIFADQSKVVVGGGRRRLGDSLAPAGRWRGCVSRSCAYLAGESRSFERAD